MDRTEIERFVLEKIAPGLMAHGGNVEILSLESGVLRLRLTGACVSCGIQAFTADAVANYILDSFPDLEDVQVSGEG